MWDPDVYLASFQHATARSTTVTVGLGGRGRRVDLVRARPLDTLPGTTMARRGDRGLDSHRDGAAAAAERGIGATTGDLRDWKPKLS